jgi:hypothetical protein
LSLDARTLLFIEQHPHCGKREVRDGVGGRVEEVDAALGRLLNRGAVTNASTKGKHSYIATGVSASRTTSEGTAQDEGLDEIPF